MLCGRTEKRNSCTHLRGVVRGVVYVRAFSHLARVFCSFHYVKKNKRAEYIALFCFHLFHPIKRCSPSVRSLAKYNCFSPAWPLTKHNSGFLSFQYDCALNITVAMKAKSLILHAIKAKSLIVVIWFIYLFITFVSVSWMDWQYQTCFCNFKFLKNSKINKNWKWKPLFFWRKILRP